MEEGRRLLGQRLTPAALICYNKPYFYGSRLYMTLGEHLRALRKQRGYTLKTVAERLALLQA